MIAASVLNGFEHPGHSDGSSVWGTVRRGPGVIGGSKPIFACPFRSLRSFCHQNSLPWCVCTSSNLTYKDPNFPDPEIYNDKCSC